MSANLAVKKRSGADVKAKNRCWDKLLKNAEKMGYSEVEKLVKSKRKNL
ncbi:hypothetical protein [Desulfotignum phosphitoxidans]|nr:hypothetical protein [Desulfotignum phosphitoxidans]